MQALSRRDLRRHRRLSGRDLRLAGRDLGREGALEPLDCRVRLLGEVVEDEEQQAEQHFLDERDHRSDHGPGGEAELGPEADARRIAVEVEGAAQWRQHLERNVRDPVTVLARRALAGHALLELRDEARDVDDRLFFCHRG